MFTNFANITGAPSCSFLPTCVGWKETPIFTGMILKIPEESASWLAKG